MMQGAQIRERWDWRWEAGSFVHQGVIHADVWQKQIAVAAQSLSRV